MPLKSASFTSDSFWSSSLNDGALSAATGTFGDDLTVAGDLDLAGSIANNLEVDNGINELLHLVDFRFANGETLIAAMYLSYGYKLKGNKKERKKIF